MKVFHIIDTHGDPTKSIFCFFAIAPVCKEKLPPLNILSGFLSHAFSTFASREFLFVEKNTNKSLTPFGKLAKELKPAHRTKTPAKIFSLPTPSWVVLYFDKFEGRTTLNITKTFKRIGFSTEPS